MATRRPDTKVRIRPLTESDLPEADRIVRLAFGTFIGLPNPSRFMDSTDYVRTRWKFDPSSAVAAELEGKLIGTNFAANWGSFGFFGPLTVDPAYWDKGIAQLLLGPTMKIFRQWGNRHLGLFTFAQSPKHVALYQKFGFWPRDLVAVTAKQVAPPASKSTAQASGGDTPEVFAQASPEDRPQLVVACREVTSAIFDGLDLEREIRAVEEQKLGDTLLVWGDSGLDAFAVCHTGGGTEAGSGVCYVKFAAVSPGPRAAQNLERLLDAVEAFAQSSGLQKIVAGVNLARREAFNSLLARGFRTETQGVAMEAGDATAGYNRAGVYILDDWR
jgi:GNAT superfamily N-acetyltransferase